MSKIIQSAPITFPDDTQNGTLEQWSGAIGAWHIATFGSNVGMFRLGRKIVEEAEELRGEMIDLDLHMQVGGDVAEELADVCIVAFAIAGRLGIDLAAAVTKKMKTNTERTWEEDDNGVYSKAGVRFHRGGSAEDEAYEKFSKGG